MVMRPEPWGEALDDVLALGPGDVRRGWSSRRRAGAASPRTWPHEYAEDDWLVFACGRYEGIDSRVAEHYAARTRVDEVSVGDYVLAGGEAAVLVMVEAIARLLPGVLGNPVSVVDDSFAPGEMAALLEGPVFTKPPVWRDRDVPEVLLSGDHGKIAAWRRDQARERTAERRPDLLD